MRSGCVCFGMHPRFFVCLLWSWLIGSLLSTTPYAAENPKSVIKLLQKVERLTEDVGQLRGEVEVLSMELDKTQKELKNRFLILDENLSRTKHEEVSVNKKKNAISSQVLIKSEDEKRFFNSAFAMIEQKKFKEAGDNFREFVNKFPDSQFIADAWYWLAEVHLSLDESQLAVNAFLKVLELNKGKKIAESAYKLGRLYDTEGSVKKARYYLKYVVDNYPKSSAALLSKSYLESMQEKNKNNQK